MLKSEATPQVVFKILAINEMLEYLNSPKVEKQISNIEGPNFQVWKIYQMC